MKRKRSDSFLGGLIPKIKKRKLSPKFPFEVEPQFHAVIKGKEDIEMLKNMNKMDRDQELFHRWEAKNEKTLSIQKEKELKKEQNLKSSTKVIKKTQIFPPPKDPHSHYSPDESCDVDFLCLQRVCLRRSEVLKHCFEPYFERMIVNSFLRIFLGKNDLGEEVFRLCQVEKVIPCEEGYKVGDVLVFQKLVLKFGTQRKEMTMNAISDDPPQLQDYSEWMNHLDSCGHSCYIPTRMEMNQHFHQNILNIEHRYPTSTEEMNRNLMEKIKLKRFNELKNLQLDDLSSQLETKKKILMDDLKNFEKQENMIRNFTKKKTGAQEKLKDLQKNKERIQKNVREIQEDLKKILDERKKRRGSDRSNYNDQRSRIDRINERNRKKNMKNRKKMKKNRTEEDLAFSRKDTQSSFIGSLLLKNKNNTNTKNKKSEEKKEKEKQEKDSTFSIDDNILNNFKEEAIDLE